MSLQKLGLWSAAATLVTFGFAASAQYIDKQGREWRKMDRSTLRVSAAQMGTVCAQDPCNGSLGGVNLTGYTWASADDVLQLMQEFDATAPSVGQAQFFTASNFSLSLGITYMFNTTYSMAEGTLGWTSSVDIATGSPILASVTYGHAMVSIDGGFGLGPAADGVNFTRSVFLFKRAGSPPPPADCALDGTVVKHGTSVTRYQSASVAYGQTCVSEARTCSDGLLSGSFTALQCVVQSPPPVVNPCKNIKKSSDRKKCEKRYATK